VPLADESVALGSNFIDTANVYQTGMAESFIGDCEQLCCCPFLGLPHHMRGAGLAARKNREEVAETP
jgi:hypothetical protein